MEVEMKKVNGGKKGVFSFLLGFFVFGVLILSSTDLPC